MLWYYWGFLIFSVIVLNTLTAHHHFLSISVFWLHIFCHCFLSVLTTVPVVPFVAHLFLLSVFSHVSACLPPAHHFVSFTYYHCSRHTYRCACTFAFSFVCLCGFVLSKGCLSLQMEAWVWQRSETETEMLTDGLSGCVRALLPEPIRQEQRMRIGWVGGGGSDCEMYPFWF